MKRQIITIILLILALLPGVVRAQDAAEVVEETILWNTIKKSGVTTNIATLLAKYAKAKAELVEIEAQLAATTKVGGKIAKTALDMVGLGKVMDAVTDKETLLAQYSTKRAEVLALQEQIQQKLYEMQRVADAARQISNGGDILSSLRATFSAISPYITNSEELVDLVDIYAEKQALASTAYNYFNYRLTQDDNDWWSSPSKLASDIQQFSYYSTKIDDDMAFITTQLLNPDNKLSQKERRDELRETYHKWVSEIEFLRSRLADAELARQRALDTRAGMGVIQDAFVPKLNSGEGILETPAELKDMAMRSIEESQIATIEETKEGYSALGNPILNFVSAIIGILAVIFTVVNSAKVQKGEPQRQDALFKVWVGAFISIIALQIVRLIFFA